MIVRKEKQFLVFDFEDGKTVKYDLATKQTIGKLGKPVKDLRSQLSGYSIGTLLDSFEDKNYGYFLKWVHDIETGITNIGTIIERSKRYARFEQIFSAGIRNVESSLKYQMSDIPSGLIKLCRERGGRLTSNLVETYRDSPDTVNIAFKLDYQNLDDRTLWNLVEYGVYHRWGGNDQKAYSWAVSHLIYERRNGAGQESGDN